MIYCIHNIICLFIFLFHSDEEQEDLDGNSLFEFQQELEARCAVRMKF